MSYFCLTTIFSNCFIISYFRNMILSETEKENIIKVISRKIDGQLKIFIYGSRIRNIASKESDIDILILSEKTISNEAIRKIKIELSEALGGTKIDIVQSTFDSKSPFVQLIEDDAVLIWERT
ncbi:nucleotidyltransferase domain-containing protein [Bacteroidetes/Chlorobi group bacterium Naka2016]|nr:MAG: nucleotidyltransferase domain-containing protein [Bacteroidetes/Chlorobi group bacterium Naka2016]